MIIEIQKHIFNKVLLEYGIYPISESNILLDFDIDKDSTEEFIKEMAKLYCEEYYDNLTKD